MQFKVPQDVQREDTIVGPLTLKQLMIIGAGGGLAYATYTTLAKLYYWQIWLPPTAILVIITLGFTFGKVHELPLLKYLFFLAEYTFIPRKRIWMKGAADAQKPLFEETKMTINKEPPKKEKSLKDLDKLVKMLDAQGAVKKP